jgi:uncharacterized ion transporter superfamily protein YfcC
MHSAESLGAAEGDRARRVRTPDTYVIVFGVVLFAALLTYLVPLGVFSTQTIQLDAPSGGVQSRDVLVPESFRLLRNEAGETIRRGVPLFAPHGEVGLFNYLFEGLVSGDRWGAAIGVFMFILVIGGAFGIVLRTGAIEAGILATIRRASAVRTLIVPVMFVVFSLGGAVFGMGEEAIAFAMILVPLVIGLGYDAVVGVLITYVATQIGFAASWMNPFSVAIAQGIAEVPVLSGAPFRMVMWAVFTALGTGFTWWYAHRVLHDPTRSAVYRPDDPYRHEFQDVSDLHDRFRLGHGLVLLSVLATVVWVIVGVTRDAYYIPEIATQFFIMGIAAGGIGVAFRLGGMRINDVASSFREGARDLLDAALIVGMAKGIVIVLGGDDPTQPTVLNTMLHGAGGVLSELPAMGSAWLMYAFQSVFNFFVVSGSGQAALTMPLMAPLADIAGVTRQVAVLAFQLGDGFTNLIVPTSGALIGTLGVARIGWATWAKFILRLMALLVLFASAFILVAVAIGYS